MHLSIYLGTRAGLAGQRPEDHRHNDKRQCGLHCRTQRSQPRTRCKKMQLKAHIQDPTFCGPWERVPLEGCERDALFLLPTFFWDVSRKALPVILC